MPRVEVILRLVVIVLLVSYLFQKHRQRLLSGSEPERPENWIGTGIDAARLFPSLKRVREDPLAARRAAHIPWHRKGLRALVRRTAGQLAYFRDRKAGHDAQEHAG